MTTVTTTMIMVDLGFVKGGPCSASL